MRKQSEYSATEDLRKDIGAEKVDLLIKINKFITEQQKENVVPTSTIDTAIDSLNRILRELIQLQKQGWISKGKAVPVKDGEFPPGPIAKILDPILFEIQLQSFMSYPIGKVETPVIHYDIVNNDPSLVLQDPSSFSRRPRKRGRKHHDAYNILLFCTVTLLQRTKCRDIYRTTANFLDEQGIHLNSTTNDSLSTQYRRLKKGDIEKLYKSYCEGPGSTKTKAVPNAKNGPKIMLYKAIPSWKDILQ